MSVPISKLTTQEVTFSSLQALLESPLDPSKVQSAALPVISSESERIPTPPIPDMRPPSPPLSPTSHAEIPETFLFPRPTVSQRMSSHGVETQELRIPPKAHLEGNISQSAELPLFQVRVVHSPTQKKTISAAKQVSPAPHKPKIRFKERTVFEKMKVPAELESGDYELEYSNR